MFQYGFDYFERGLEAAIKIDLIYMFAHSNCFLMRNHQGSPKGQFRLPSMIPGAAFLDF